METKTRDQALHELEQNVYVLLENVMTRDECERLKAVLHPKEIEGRERLREEGNSKAETQVRIGNLVQFGAPFRSRPPSTGFSTIFYMSILAISGARCGPPTNCGL